MEAILTSSFDWNGIRPPMIFATENDCLNGACMLLGYLLTNTAQIFADVRTYWSPEAVKRVTGTKLAGPARRRPAASHQFRRRHARRFRPAIAQRQARDETVLGNHRKPKRRNA